MELSSSTAIDQILNCFEVVRRVAMPLFQISLEP